MGKRGPKASVSYDERIAEFKKYNIFEQDGSLKKESDTTWNIICKNLSDPPEKVLNKRNLYIFVTKNLKKIKNDLNEKEERLLDADKTNTRVNCTDNNMDEKLLKLHNNVLFKPLIQEISMYPVTIFHWSLEATDLSSELCVDTKYYFCLIDNFSKAVERSDGSFSEPLFTQSLGIVMDNKFIPICQMTTEDQTFALFYRFFFECLRTGLALPCYVEMDFIRTQILSANAVFNVDLSYEQYLSKCFLNLQGSENNLPHCIIHTDVRFLIVKVLNFFCIQKVLLDSIKYFYVYVLILLSYQQNLFEFEMILKKIIILINKRTKDLQTKQLIKELLTDIKESKINEKYSKTKIMKIQDDYEKTVLHSNDYGINESLCPEVLIYIENLFTDSENAVNDAQTDTSYDLNPYYNNEFSYEIKKLCTEFIIWSNVMPQCHTESSLSLDQIVQEYKSDFGIINKQIPLDVFLMENLKYYEEKLSAARKSCTVSNNNNKKKSGLSFMFYEENWKGQNPENDEDLNEDYDSESVSNESVSDQSNHEDISRFLQAENSTTSVDLEDKTVSDIELDEKDDIDQKLFVKSLKTNQLKQRGKYVTPGINLNILQPINMPKNRKVLKNYNLTRPRQIKKNKILITTSSHLDCIVEIFTSAYHGIKKFQNFIIYFTDSLDICKHLFLDIIRDYTNSLNAMGYNKKRPDLLSKILNINKNNKFFLDPCHSLGDFYEKIGLPTLVNKIECSFCKNIIYQVHTSIKLPLKSIISNEIDQHINNFFKTSKFCSCSRSFLSSVFVRNMFCIDVEEMSKEKVLQNQNKLSDFIPTLSLNNQNFILLGVVGFEEAITLNDPRHYVAYTRKVQGNWYKFDNSQHFNKAVKVKDNFSFNPALIFYF